MKKVTLLIVSLICLLNNKIFSQDIFIYHARDGSTSVIKPNGELISTASSTEGNVIIVREPGKNVRIKIVNPNTIIYNYELNNEKLNDTEELPDISPFLKAFEELILNGSPSAGGGITFGNKVNTDSNGSALAEPIVNPSAFDAYISAIKLLRDKLLEVNTIIKNSDEPESISAAINNEVQGGIRLAKTKIPNELNSPTLLDDLNLLAKDATENPFLFDYFKVLNADLVSKISDIKK